jgi:hypothetical protein
MTETPTENNKVPSRRLIAFCLLAIGLLSFYLNTFHNDFLLRYHPDERKKVKSVLNGKQDFKHPILMLQVNRLCNKINRSGVEKTLAILHVGRTVNALFGVVIALTTYFIAVRIMRKRYALFSALAVAVSPILVIHAHYFKEDMILVAMFMLALTAFLHLLQKPGWLAALCVGILTGMTASSHYKGLLMLVVFAVAPLITDKARNRKFAMHMGLIVLVSAITFAAINYPMFIKPEDFKKGTTWSMLQATHGHQLKIYPAAFFFCFHIIHSIIPGMTWLPAVCSIAVVAYATCRYRSLDWQARILLAALLIFYLAVEISPMKEFPGYMRYVLPTVPLLLIFCGKGLDQLAQAITGKPYRSVILATGLLLILLPALASARLVWHLHNETRDQAVKLVAARGKSALFESYSCQYRGIDRLARVGADVYREQGFRYLVASSFMYDRYMFGDKLKHQHPDVHKYHRRYKELFTYPYMEIRPAYKSFALSNPVIRIIDIGEE